MKTRFYWLLSDGKTVREISMEEWREKWNRNMKSINYRYQLVKKAKTDALFVKGKEGVWVRLEQLRRVLGDNQ